MELYDYRDIYTIDASVSAKLHGEFDVSIFLAVRVKKIGKIELITKWFIMCEHVWGVF
ncbi:hypothetical protein FH581_015790 [Leptospira weilii]|uniref:hypothetical protein n=1 Tax=Leptospira weilii TaxID=28184 RepID=UPI001EF292D3|nr:hypothetical protein [Leptospira weilii]MDL5246103.1 hypothetical protein [Leptospira weilii]ULH28656.1 hypothetical protein FH586_20595 [Leptospira weilii]UPY79666.1 hypothetical protein FH581_015790 [Leptospira weilii]